MDNGQQWASEEGLGGHGWVSRMEFCREPAAKFDQYSYQE